MTLTYWCRFTITAHITLFCFSWYFQFSPPFSMIFSFLFAIWYFIDMPLIFHFFFASLLCFSRFFIDSFQHYDAPSSDFKCHSYHYLYEYRSSFRHTLPYWHWRRHLLPYHLFLHYWITILYCFIVIISQDVVSTAFSIVRDSFDVRRLSLNWYRQLLIPIYTALFQRVRHIIAVLHRHLPHATYILYIYLASLLIFSSEDRVRITFHSIHFWEPLQSLKVIYYHSPQLLLVIVIQLSLSAIILWDYR